MPPSEGMLHSMSHKLQELIKTVRSITGKQVSQFIAKTILNLTFSSLLTLLATFLCWLIYFRPYKLHPHIDSAVLVSFHLDTPPAALSYDLSLNMTIINKSSARVRLDHLAAGLYYSGIKIGPSVDTLPSFKLKEMGSQKVYPVLHGQASDVSAAVAEAFARERALGQFNLNVRFKTLPTYRFFPHKVSYYVGYDCWLQFPPVPGDGTPAVTGGFKCDVAK